MAEVAAAAHGLLLPDTTLSGGWGRTTIAAAAADGMLIKIVGEANG